MSVVGVFRSEDAARAAIRRLDEAGFPPEKVAVVVDNVRQAREAAGSYSRTGAVAGGIAGLLVALAFLALGGPAMSQNPVAAAIGTFGLVAGGVVVGVLAGRAKLFKEPEFEHLEARVDAGDALVTIRCDHEECVVATMALRDVGAVQVREEDTPETP